MLAVNVTGTFLCTQRALRPMVAARYGRIINFSTQLDRRTAVPARCTTVSSSPPAAPGRS
jgi:NAD(P)-dependent dehydrogenase (short-subunit alcohol dehydrogenase family)